MTTQTTRILIILAALTLLFGTLSPYELTSYHCNRALKSLFLPTDHTADIRKAREPDPSILFLCPAIQLTCCSLRELQHIVRSFITSSEGFKAYMNDIISNLDVIDLLYESIQAGLLKNDTMISEDEEKNCGDMNNEMIETLVHKLYKQKRVILKLIDNYTREMLVYFSGFACTICDGIDVQYISNNQNFEISLNESLCTKQLDLHLTVLKTAKLVYNLSSLAQLLACKKGGKVHKEEWADDILTVIKRTLSIKECISSILTVSIDYNYHCGYLCKSVLNVLFWEDEYFIKRNSYLSSDTIKRFIDSARKQQFFDEVAKKVSRQFDEKSDVERVSLYTVRWADELHKKFTVKLVKNDGLNFYMNGLEIRSTFGSFLQVLTGAGILTIALLTIM